MLDWFDWDDMGCIAFIGAIVLILAIMVGIFFLESWFIMLLWNAVVVVVMEWNALSFWMACGLNLLCTLLFAKIIKIPSKK
jgi:hypothetical protein